jgi:soluble P-type ATPase
MGTRVGTTTNDLMVLKTGDIAVEVLGDNVDLVQKLAGYVLANLP